MSISVKIRTDKHPEPKDVFDALFNKGEAIIITSPDYPCAKFGNLNTALRGVEFYEEDNGIEVRVCSFGSADDYRLFAKTVKAVMDLTGGKAFFEDDDEEEITDPLTRFNESWVNEQRESFFNMYRILILQYGSKITIYGLFAPICIGPRLLKWFGIKGGEEPKMEIINNLQDYLISIQWHLSKLQDTKTRLAIPNRENPAERGKNISLIAMKNGKVSDFDYISFADIFCIMDMDNEETTPVLVPFDKITKIIPNKGFHMIDEYQVERTEELTSETFHQIMERARLYQPDDLMHEPISPGGGYDETQNTVILMWNPAISSVKLEDHNKSIPNLFTEVFNWSVWEHEKAKCGDRFFLVRCGEGNTGIVMSGIFESHPYEADDWSGKGRQTFYMDMKPNVILNPDTAPMITTDQLEKEIPNFQWDGGHSGRILQPNDSKKLEEMWKSYLKENHDSFDGITMNAVGLFETVD